MYQIMNINETLGLNLMQECQSRGMCIQVGFYVIWYIWLCEPRWWALPPQMDLSLCTTVYVQRGCWVSNQSRFWPVWSGTCLQIPTKSSLDLSWLMGWLSHLGMPVWHGARQPSAWICHICLLLCRRFVRSGSQHDSLFVLTLATSI